MNIFLPSVFLVLSYIYNIITDIVEVEVEVVFGTLDIGTLYQSERLNETEALLSFRFKLCKNQMSIASTDHRHRKGQGQRPSGAMVHAWSTA